jgi:hypothetical protein
MEPEKRKIDHTVSKLEQQRSEQKEPESYSQFAEQMSSLENARKKQVLGGYGVTRQISQLPEGVAIRMWRVRTIIILVAIGMIIGFACGVSLGIRIKP